MVLSTSVAAGTLGAERICRYRHNPYGPRILEPLPVNTAVAPSPVAAALDFPFMEDVDKPLFYTGLVEFKYKVMEFQAPFSVQIGDAVVTEADRGEDLGFVKHVELFSNKNDKSRVKLLRVATAADLERHAERIENEKKALATMSMLAWKVRCPAHIKDIMYQLDGRKITIIIDRESRSFIDFRRLQRAAFDVFRCRVWCEYLDEILSPQKGDTNGAPSLFRSRAVRKREPRCSGRTQPEPREVPAHA